MEYKNLVPAAFDLSPYRFGMPQQSGPMTVVPVFGLDRQTGFTGPMSGLKLSQVTGYGSMELANPGETGVAIVPLHMGYIQDQAQNHALCRSAFIAAGQKLLFEDACCVQAAQGGYLEGREQWFFILPVQLRDRALQLRGEHSYSKLWGDIAVLNQQFGLPDRGHLEQIITKQRAFLTQYQSRLELLPGQTGALFLINHKLAGIEIAPSAAYFAEMWMPLTCFCYGTAAMYLEQKTPTKNADIAPLSARNLTELRQQLEASRTQLRQRVQNDLAQTPKEMFELIEEERFLQMRLHTATGENFAGQFVQEDGQVLYASIFAKPHYLNN